MNFKMFLRIFIACAMMLALIAGCDGDIETPKETKTPADTSAPANTGGTDDKPAPSGEYRDLGGLDINIGIWWEPTIIDPNSSAFESDRYDYREEMYEKHNFKVYEEAIASFSSIPTIAQASILSGDPEAKIFTLDSSNVVSLLRHNLFYAVNELPSFDPNFNKWNKYMLESMTFDGNIYGFSHEYVPWNVNGLFFNKNVLADAGYDMSDANNYIYEHQKNGTWTWDVFLEICETVTKDTDNDGITDIYGVCSFNRRALDAAIWSNGASYVEKEPGTGLFVNNALSSEFLQAVNFTRSLQELGYVKEPALDAPTDWFIKSYNEGDSAFRMEEEYAKSDLAGVDFDWGFVFFPKGPNADDYVAVYRENVRVLPAIFDEQTADDIMFGYALYVADVPGYEDDQDTWKFEAYASYCDRRAVDETVAMIRSGDLGAIRMDPYVMGFTSRKISDTLWYLEKTARELIDEAMPIWDTEIEETNMRISNR